MMNTLIKSLVAMSLALGLGAAHAQSISVSPSGNVSIGNNDAGNNGRATAPGQMQNRYGGSARDFAPGQQRRNPTTLPADVTRPTTLPADVTRGSGSQRQGGGNQGRNQNRGQNQ